MYHLSFEFNIGHADNLVDLPGSFLKELRPLHGCRDGRRRCQFDGRHSIKLTFSRQHIEKIVRESIIYNSLPYLEADLRGKGHLLGEPGYPQGPMANSLLLKLPQELRDKIYQYIFKAVRPICQSLYAARIDTNILRVSKQIHAEARKLLINENVVNIYLPLSDPYEILKVPYLNVTIMDIWQAHQVNSLLSNTDLKSLVISIGKKREWDGNFWGIVDFALQDLIRFAKQLINLKNLKVHGPVHLSFQGVDRFPSYGKFSEPSKKFAKPMLEDLDILLKVLEHRMRGGVMEDENTRGTAMLDGDGLKDFGESRYENCLERC